MEVYNGTAYIAACHHCQTHCYWGRQDTHPLTGHNTANQPSSYTLIGPGSILALLASKRQCIVDNICWAIINQVLCWIYIRGQCLNLETISRLSCQKGPTWHVYAWQIGPFWQDTLDMWTAQNQRTPSCLCATLSCLVLPHPPWSGFKAYMGMGLLPDTLYSGLRMCWECREHFPRYRELAIPTCITARACRTCRDACWDR